MIQTMDVLDKLQLRPSPLNLDGYFIKKLSFCVSEDMENENLSPLILRSGYHPQFENFAFEAKLNFGVDFVVSTNSEDPFKYKCTLNIKSLKTKNVKCVYDYEVEIVGYFYWEPEEEFPEVARAAQTSAMSLLYSSAREALASATARSPFPALVLPTVWIKFSKTEDDKSKVRVKKIPSKPRKKLIKKSAKS